MAYPDNYADIIHSADFSHSAHPAHATDYAQHSMLIMIQLHTLLLDSAYVGSLLSLVFVGLVGQRGCEMSGWWLR